MPDITATVTGHPFRLSFDPKSDVQTGMLKNIATPEGYEPGTWRTFCDTLQPGDCVVDVGAHVGVFTCLAASLVGPGGHVYAFEPNAANRRRLVHNVKQNGYQDRVTISPCACSDHHARTSLYRCADNDGGHALYDPGLAAWNAKSRAKPQQALIETICLDDVIDRPVRLVKIDTEGAEAHVLRGARRILDVDRPVVIAEINAFGLAMMKESEQTLRTIFQVRGYRETVIQDVAPFRVPLTELQTAQQKYVDKGVLCLPVFNMAWGD